MSDVFISYARANEAQARAAADALRALGCGVWRDDELPAHRAYADVIQERLEAAKAVLVLWSAEAAKSHWVRAEADAAREAGTLVQMRLDATVPPMPFNQIQCADLAGWSGDPAAPGWAKVAASVAELVGGRTEAKPSAATAAPKELSICVLPFANISGDAEQEYFSDGISEDIITDLAKVSALSVTARNTAFTYKGRAANIPHLARELGVTHVLEGSVRKAGARVRITAQLIDGVAGDHLWAERWDRDLTDIFALQDEISQAIVAALKLELLPEEKRAIERRDTESVEAYNLLLMARQQLLGGNMGNPGRAEGIIRLAQRAIEIDPGYARAWTVLAGIQYEIQTYHGRGGDGGLAAVEKAIALAPHLAEPHAVKARTLHALGRDEEAAAEIEHALRLDPDSPEVNVLAAVVAYRGGRLADAERFYVRASALDRGGFVWPGLLISIRRILGETGGAREAARLCLERVEPVLAQYPNNGNAIAWGARALAALGEADRARGWIERARLVDPENVPMHYNLACTLAGWLEDRDGAIDLLTPIVAAGRPGLLDMARSDVDLDSLRHDPRFRAMLAAAAARFAET